MASQVLIVYFSRSGNTARMAELVAEGVRQGGAESAVKAVAEAKISDLAEAQGIILGSPTYYGSMAAEIKCFIDASVKLHGQLAGKVGGAFTSSGGIAGGNETTVLDMLKALLIHGMVIPGNCNGDHYGPVAVGAPDQRAADQCRLLGKMVGELAVKLHG